MAKLTKTQEFYKGKSIFITGASGFMGKVLLEKLLYSCSDLKQIMILVRPKRGKSAAQRVADFSTLPVSSQHKIKSLREGLSMALRVNHPLASAVAQN
jgi:alcohol-forming fatty acyl-CoA reductase